VAVTAVHYKVVGDLEMKMVAGCFFCRSGSLGLVTSSAALAGGKRPLPVPAFAMLRRARGSPPATAAEVAQAFRQSLRRHTRKHLEGATSFRVGQGELRRKQHRSNRCEASAARNDQHLLRREDNPTEAKLVQYWQRLCWFAR